MRSNTFAAWERIKIGLNHTVFGLSGTIFNFVFSILMVRFYSAELWGSFAQLMLMMTFFTQITGWGSKDFLVREFSRNTQLSHLWQTSLTSRMLIFLLMLPIIWMYGSSQQVTYLFTGWCLVNFVLRSFDSAIVFERKFYHAVFIELAGFLAILASFFLLGDRVTLPALISLFIGSAVLKILLYLPIFRKQYIEPIDGAFSQQYLILSIPYFLPPFISFLNAKADTFAIALTLSEKELGEYYVLVSLLSYCHAVGALALVPFLKNIYRIKAESLRKIKRAFFLGGMTWATGCLIATYFLLEYIYKIHFEVQVYLVSALAMPPFFIYYLLMQEFFKNDKPYPVVIINLVTAVVNFAVSLVLIHFLGFLGGLIAFATMQWMILFGFVITRNKLLPDTSIHSTQPR
jgi:O-antigen/teichoic acid export membrane protein